MSVHVVKNQERYGNASAFNWKYNDFADLLGVLGCEVNRGDNEYSERFEVLVKEYKTAMKLLKAYKKYGECNKVWRLFEEYDADTDIEMYLVNLGGIDYVMGSMKDFFDERDKGSEWIQFVVW